MRMVTGGLLLLMMASAGLDAGAQEIVVIVNVANPVSSISKSQLSKIFLKRAELWDNKRIIVPIDQQQRSKAREQFSKVVHGRSSAMISSYWQTQIFSGKNVPPVAKPNDLEVIAAVQANENAIGYVTAGTPLGPHVKAIKVGDL